ncbi:MAG: hypothetical protein PHS71_07990 [Proteiniphilum sp.]|nr:hypothetical protein [Proteiniphilum sp.]
MSHIMYAFIKCYFFSGHRKIYRSIAREFHTTVIHVYRLAHGKRGKGNRDYYIKKRLREEGIIETVIT